MRHTYRELSFEVLGGVNSESYMMLRVMLVVRGNRITERDQIDLYNNFQLTAFVKKVAEKVGFSCGYVEEAFNQLINELEMYRQQEREQQSLKYTHDINVNEEGQNEAIQFLKSPNLIQDTSLMISKGRSYRKRTK